MFFRGFSRIFKKQAQLIAFVRLYDILGAVILEANYKLRGKDELVIGGEGIKNLPSGKYVLMISSDKGPTKAVKLIKLEK